MEPVSLLAALVPESAPDEWYVTDGATAIGPVGLELLARGITSGKVPLNAFVRHASWSGWRGLSDLAEHDPSFDPRQTIRVLNQAGPARETLPSIDLEDGDFEVEDAAEARFDAAADLPEALLVLLAKTVQRCHADAVLVHRARSDGATVVCSHGPRMFELVGDELAAGDPVLFAAKQGATLLVELVPGVAGRAIKARLSRLGARVESAFMVPVCVDGRLTALVEVGRAAPFRAGDAASVEALVDDLVAAIRASSWSLEWDAAPNRANMTR